MKTLLIPLDERPCNYYFPQMVAASQKKVELLVPPKELLGRKKEPADSKAIAAFLEENIENCDNLVLSVDMLLYGGLIPSRLHHLTEGEAIERLQVIRRLKQKNPNMKIYGFHCIMRAPSYNSAEEEPDYYEEYGYALFRRKYLLDYKRRHGLEEAEKKELEGIRIPEEIIMDYETRRDFNTRMNLEVVHYLEEGYIDFLVIPQDDSSPYGYTAISQKCVIDAVKQKHLEQKVMIYPGADEVAMSLLARAYNEYLGIEPKVYAFYASVLGPTIVPNYEDRPMLESLKSHIRVCKAKLVEQAKEADVILAINSPGKIMQEAYVKENDLDISYTSYRNLPDFAYRIKDYAEEGYPVALCDSAFSNGGDLQLIQYLDSMNVLDKLISYAGWNTNCNSLGTTLAQAFIGDKKNKKHLCYRIIEDVLYQAVVREEIVENELGKMGLSYFCLGDKQPLIEGMIKERLQKQYDRLKIGGTYPVTIQGIHMPWYRMFEIGMEIEM
ncbi:MAG: DUF4127 family protein [Lachnospiraceae bacterium]|nr:DUF4127 family protein [Lachnospiraceae bacterium]